ncbi:unnamed protein product [Protopolystoma xenopodis]|uniref:Armadillo repeat-containing domain-containing protein n=1 Tax=Protopolystoma xenopodis TaxID=117903 RepID=A0A3S5AG62_9PLAT|nr:unnamed protein product [Protopolystoma xenopodis]
MLLRQGPSCLVASVCNSLIELMQEPTVLSQFCQLDGLRLLALHASKGHHTTRIAAIRALHSCVRRNQETGRLLKPLIGFLHDLVNLCRSNAKDQDAEHATCCVIAEVAKNPRCLAVLTDLGVLGLIEQLIPRAETDQMKAALASAISSCAVYGSNTEVLGRPKNIQYLLGYLKTTNRETLAETIRAFCVLSRSPKVARHIYEAGISKVLLKMIGSADVELQAAVAMAIRNINKLNQMDDHFLDKLASQQVFKGTPGNSEEALLITKAAASIKAI